MCSIVKSFARSFQFKCLFHFQSPDRDSHKLVRQPPRHVHNMLRDLPRRDVHAHFNRNTRRPCQRIQPCDVPSASHHREHLTCSGVICMIVERVFTSAPPPERPNQQGQAPTKSHHPRGQVTSRIGDECLAHHVLSNTDKPRRAMLSRRWLCDQMRTNPGHMRREPAGSKNQKHISSNIYSPQSSCWRIRRPTHFQARGKGHLPLSKLSSYDAKCVVVLCMSAVRRLVLHFAAPCGSGRWK